MHTHRAISAAFLVFLLVAFTFLPSTTLACECGDESPLDRWEKGQIPQNVFAGRLISIASSTNGSPNARVSLFVDMTFAVSRVWSGDIGQTVVVRGITIGASCGWYTRDTTKEYVIFATGETGVLSTGLCSGNHLLSQSTIPQNFGPGSAPRIDVPAQVPTSAVAMPKVVSNTTVTAPVEDMVSGTHEETKVATPVPATQLPTESNREEIVPIQVAAETTALQIWKDVISSMISRVLSVFGF